MSTKMDDKIESLYEKEIEAKISYEGYARLDEGLYTDITVKSFLKGLKSDSTEVVKMGVNYYIFDKKRVKIYEIKDIPAYIRYLSAYKEEDMFFRGQSDSNYLLQPSIVREIRWRKNEKLMFDELERLCPKEFYNLNTILDKLVEMQHYNLPTRLLDVSSNALVALLFACQNCEIDGEVLIFKDRRDRGPYTGVKETNIRYGHSDSVSLLTGISQMNYRDQLLLYYIACFFIKLITEKIPITSWFNTEDNCC